MSLALVTAGDTAGAGWVVLDLDVPADYVLEVEHGALVHGEIFAHGVHLMTLSGLPLARAVTTMETEGPARYHLEANGVEVSSPRVVMHERLASRLALACEGCAAGVVRLVSLVAGDVSEASWSVAGEGVRVRAQSGGEGAFVHRAEDFSGLQLEAGTLGREAQVNADGRVHVDVEGQLVASYVKQGGEPLLMEAQTPAGRLACPCAFPEGPGSGGAGAYTFRLSDADAGGEAYLVGADVRFP